MNSSPLLSKELHDTWKSRYRTPENARFYETAYRTIHEYFGKVDGLVLDAGCGTGEKTVRLVRHGYRVIGLDFAPVVLAEAKDEIARAEGPGIVGLTRGDLTMLPFADDTFGAVVIWGVLMHVPELERAVAELCRVLKPGGKIVVYDVHAASLDARLIKWIKAVTRHGANTRTATGIENWVGSKENPVLVRWVYYSALRRLFEAGSVTFEGHRAGQFTQLFVYLKSSRLRRAVHAWNDIYFRLLRWPLPAYGLMAFGKKRSSRAAA